MTKLKICGVMSPRDANIINQCRPDFAGVVFAPGRHQVDVNTAAKLRRLINERIPVVGVFVDEPITQIIALAQAGTIQMAQLHGHESVNDIQKLQSAGVTVIDVHVDNLQTIMDSNADYIMIDSGQGSGKPLAWQQLPKLPQSRLFVAGGINPGNMVTVIKTLHPAVIDVSSGSETNGTKDIKLIEQLVAIAHQY